MLKRLTGLFFLLTQFLLIHPIYADEGVKEKLESYICLANRGLLGSEASNLVYSYFCHLLNHNLKDAYPHLLKEEWIKNQKNRSFFGLLPFHLRRLNPFRVASYFFFAHKLIGINKSALNNLETKDWRFVHTVNWLKVLPLTALFSLIHYAIIRPKQGAEHWYVQLKGMQSGDVKLIPPLGYVEDKKNWKF